MEEISEIIDNAEEITGVIEQDVIVAGVTSVNGKAGDLSLKTINNTDLLTAGNIDLQEPLTAGENITIENNVISAAGSTASYTAGTGLNLTDNEFSIDETVVATKTDLAGKQNTLTTTQLNAVNSGIDSTKVAQIATNTGDITTIESKIPAQASSSNQLADKNFVNSSISTETANYISNNGEPFTSVAQLEAYTGTVTDNDYAFVTGTDTAGNTYYDRYKATVSGNTVTWAKEYRLNNSSFTSDQWAAINSGITSSNVTKLTGLAEIKTIGSNLTLDANGELSASVPSVVQTTGTSQTDVMSQDATTSMVYADPSTQYKIRLGKSASVIQSYGIAIGNYASASGSRGIAIGTAYNHNNTNRASASGSLSIAFGEKTNASAESAIAYGFGASASGIGSIALGANSSATSNGEFNIGSSSTYYGYNSSNYRLLTGLYDPQSAHDAATKGYVDGTTETLTIATSDWSALASSDPYDYSATVTAVTTIGANSLVELLNDQAVLFGTHGFAIGSISGQSVTIYSVGQPSASVSLKINVKG